MIVCHCHGVSDGNIREAVRAGSRTPEEVAQQCGAGTGCGGCFSLVCDIVESERNRPRLLPTILAAAALPGA